MSSRRHRHTPPIESLGISRSPTWIIAVDNWGRILESNALEENTDLYDALVRESLRYHADGWKLEERMFYLKEFYVRRNGDTSRRVYITGLDPKLLRLETSGHYNQFGFECHLPTSGLRA